MIGLYLSMGDTIFRHEKEYFCGVSCVRLTNRHFQTFIQRRPRAYPNFMPCIDLPWEPYSEDDESPTPATILRL